MFTFDRSRKAKSLQGGGLDLIVLHENVATGKHCIVEDTDGLHWMSVIIQDDVMLYPMRAI